MNAISSAAPCHVLVSPKGSDPVPSRHDVICWTIDDGDGTPCPWILYDGEVVSVWDLRNRTWKVSAVTMRGGPASAMAER